MEKKVINQFVLVWNDETKVIILSQFIDSASIATGEQIEVFDTEKEMNEFIIKNNIINEIPN